MFVKRSGIYIRRLKFALVSSDLLIYKVPSVDIPDSAVTATEHRVFRKKLSI